jgi:hypothetical protein
VDGVKPAEDGSVSLIDMTDLTFSYNPEGGNFIFRVLIHAFSGPSPPD